MRSNVLKRALSFSFLVQQCPMGAAHGALIRWCLRRQHRQGAAMGRYSHLTIEERKDVMCLRRQGKGVSEIARAIDRDKSTVSRELARNSCARFYRASTAGQRYESRRGGVPQAAAARRPREARSRQGARARGAMAARAAGGKDPFRAPRPRPQRHDDLPRDRLRRA